ncbi:hypothetical protein V6N13_056998 [Hibiscus sabdariffa]|uniref:Uncharacterized protein n=1 Tax=Hibiscus sabdariffa TaxID=183260 RepID=A0ABR2D2L4_9ROSI
MTSRLQENMKSKFALFLDLFSWLSWLWPGAKFLPVTLILPTLFDIHAYTFLPSYFEFLVALLCQPRLALYLFNAKPTHHNNEHNLHSGNKKLQP